MDTTMPDSADALDQQIAALEAALQLPLPADTHQRLMADLRALRDQRAAGGGTLQGATTVSGTLHGAAVGVNQGTVQVFFGAAPPADGQALLDGYLKSLIAAYGRLRLGKLLGKEQTGREATAAPTLALRDVYTALATNARLPRGRFSLAARELRAAMDAADPETVLPDQVCLAVVAADAPARRAGAIDADRLAPPSGRLANQWRALRRFVAVPGGEHNDLAAFPAYWAAIDEALGGADTP
jgi:hypothetical protein